MKDKNKLLRMLPKVDECLGRLAPYLEDHRVPLRLAKKAVQRTIEHYRQELLADRAVDIPSRADHWDELFVAAIGALTRPNLRRVINGTGIVVHTNLGRSLLSAEATARLTVAGSHYTNLEFDLATGKRGSRYSLVEEIVCDLTGAEAALVVNNNAAAVLIALDTLARGGEVVVSRGQLVEIGGSFRVPDVMRKSGATLVEVGATNRTHLYDFEGAISAHTKMFLRVHTSNFKIIGFASQVPAEDLVALAHEHDIVVMEDLGSGCLTDVSRFGLPPEPTVQEVVKSGVDVITFSGDKLLGGPQAGLIVGNKKIIDRIKKNPLNRALRIDKFTLATLESVLREYYEPEAITETIPTLRMIGADPAAIKRRAQRLKRRIGKRLEPSCEIALVQTNSMVGGGALPEYNLASWAIELRPKRQDVAGLERGLRALPLPLIGRIEHDRFLIDCRTVLDRDVVELGDLLVSYFETAG